MGGHRRRPTDGAPQDAPRGRADRRKAVRRARRRRRRSVLKEVPVLVGVALLIALVLKTFLLQAFVIPSGSMEQTIRIGDRVLVDKLTPWFGRRPARGDVVVFKDPGGWLDGERTGGGKEPAGLREGRRLLTFIGLLPSANEQDLIKRVIGVGGDTVACCDDRGRVTVNSRPLDEPYLHPGNPPSQLRFEVRVPPGRIFVMGDHRSDSADSRAHLDEPGRGTVPEGLVVGRATVVAWPPGHWRTLAEGAAFARVGPARGAMAPSGAAQGPPNRQGMSPLPTPVQPPLVIGVMGLRRMRDRRQRGVRSGCGGCGGRRAVRSGRARQAAPGH
ncbi:signal peptidase I [Streptomyces orinoci]|uniref:signal peptidase I n=1 Tax=Streptomyces orinoci TaxID=67339 RepID=UPI001F4E6041|nr:signal peptidase I [Streptomyces orinoci]